MMKQEAILKKIGLILEELNEQYEFLTQNTQEFSELELDLFLANSNFLANHIEIIKKITVNQSNSNLLKTEKSSLDSQDVSNDIEKETENMPLVLREEVKFENELTETEFIKQEEITSVFEEIEEPVFKLDKFAKVISTFSESSFNDIFRLAIITSKFTTIAIIIQLIRVRLEFLLLF